MAQKYTCEGCGKQLSRSGYYKHRKKCDLYNEVESSEPIIIQEEVQETVIFSEPEKIEESEKPDIMEDDSEPQIQEEPQRPDWFDFEVVEEDTTEHFPTPLKMLASQGTFAGGTTPTKQQIEAMHNTNLNLLIMGLGGVDMLIQSYGRAVTLDKDLVVKHSTSDKEMVATAQYNWLLEKGINPSLYVSTGAIATALTGYYVVPPILKIRKRSKVKLLKGLRSTGGNILGKIPLIGRFFRRKNVAQSQPDITAENELK
jgi:hypothetical protein